MPTDLTRILVMSDVVLPLAEIKKRLSEIVDGVEVRHDRVVLTRHGRPAAVIISPDELESRWAHSPLHDDHGVGHCGRRICTRR